MASPAFGISFTKGGGMKPTSIEVNFDGSERMSFDGTGLSFFGAAPVAQQAHLADVVTTATTQSSPYGFATQAQGDALVARVNSIIGILENLGLKATS